MSLQKLATMFTDIVERVTALQDSLRSADTSPAATTYWSGLYPDWTEWIRVGEDRLQHRARRQWETRSDTIKGRANQAAHDTTAGLRSVRELERVWYSLDAEVSAQEQAWATAQARADQESELAGRVAREIAQWQIDRAEKLAQYAA